MLVDVFQRGRFAEAGFVLITLRPCLPGVEGAGDLLDVLGGEIAQHAVFHVAELAGVDEERFAAAVALAACPARRPLRLFLVRNQMQAGIWVLVKSWPGSATMHSTRSASIEARRMSPSSLELRTHRAVGEQQRHGAIRRQVVEHVLHPGEVGVALRRRAVLPARVVAFSLPSHHSLMLKGGLAMTKSARRSGCWSLVKVLAGSLPKLKSMPRMAMFIAASRQVVGLDSCP